MKNIRLIATDMDNTLLTSAGQLPPGFEDTIRELQAAGIEFAAASGRPLYTLKNVFADFGDSITYICDNGGSVFHQGQNIFESMIEPATYHDAIQVIQEQTNGICILCGMDSGYICTRDLAYKEYINNFFQNLTVVDDLATVFPKAPKVTVYFPNNDSQVYYDRFFNPRFGETFTVTTSGDCWLDLMNKDVNKGTAITFLGAKIGIDRSQMMAFGDTFNDREMLQAVDYSYLVANAHADMQSYAKFRTASNDEFGVLQTIKKVLAAHK